jgi:hypothetical protein
MLKSYEKLSLLLVALLPLSKAAEAQTPPVQLGVVLPRANGPFSTLTGGNYTIALQIKVPHAVAFIDDLGAEAIVIKDPDNCIDMSHFSSSGPYETCAGGPNETFIEFHSERSDQPFQSDFCTFALSSRLVDDAYDPGNVLNLNKPYLIAGNVSGTAGSTDGILELRPVGAGTGGPSNPGSFDDEDCYGLSNDDDLPGLVLMADVGPMRVFDEDFNLVGSRIRNFAGMLNSVTIELNDSFDGSSIMAFLRVPDGLLEPLTLVDRSITNPNVDFMTRRDSGPVQSHTFSTPPGNQRELVAAILATYPDVNVRVRAVIVQGEAPAFIDDLDGDGTYTAKDVQLAGYTLLSNQVNLQIHAVQNDVISEYDPFKCPAAILAGDLDGDGQTGYSCNTGNARSIRRPPDP